MNWQTTHIRNFKGLASSDRSPDINACSVIENLDTRGLKGDLELMKGYSKLYAQPQDASLTATSYLGIAEFHTEAHGGKDITIYVKKGKVSGENTAAVFMRPYWNGSAWVDGWDWINKIIVSSISLDISNNYEFYLNTPFFDADKWVIYNKTRNQYAKIFKSLNEDGNLRVKLARHASSWNTADVCILMRNYIPYEDLGKMYTAAEITTHKVLNGIRIAFPNTDAISLAVQYVNKTLWFDKLSFEGADADLTSTDNKNKFKTIDEFVCQAYNTYGMDGTTSIVQLSGGSLSSSSVDTWKIAPTLILDEFNEFYFGWAGFVWTQYKDIFVYPIIDVAKLNKRLTGINIYAGDIPDGNEELYFAKYYPFTEKDAANNPKFIINTDGNFIFPAITDNLITGANCVNQNNETNAVTGITDNNPGSLSSVVNPEKYSQFMLRIPTSGIDSYDRTVTFSSATLTAGTTYDISFRIKSEYLTDPNWPGYNFHISINGVAGPTVYISPDKVWQEYKATIIAGSSGGVVLYLEDVPGGKNSAEEANNPNYTHIDNLVLRPNGQFQAENLTVTGTTLKENEITSVLGHTEPDTYAKSWNQAIVLAGKTHILSPYYDERKLNYIYRSMIDGNGAFMYDVIPPSDYYKLEEFDGDDTVAFAALPTLDFFVAKKNSIKYLDADLGRQREIAVNTGIASAKSLSNKGDALIWCGDADIYASDGIRITNLTDGTIRDVYRELDKSLIIATSEKLDNTYRFRPAAGVEYLLTPRGWIKSVKQTAITDYLKTGDNILFIGSDGDIYREQSLYTQAGQPIAFDWKSIPIDKELLGLPGNSVLYIRSISVYYELKTEGTANFTFNILRDGAFYQGYTYNRTGAYEGRETEILKNGCNAKKIQLEITGTANCKFTVKAISFMWNILRTGRHG